MVFFGKAYSFQFIYFYVGRLYYYRHTAHIYKAEVLLTFTMQ